MKNILLTVMAVFCAVLIQAQTKEEKEVADVVEQLRVAMVNGDSVQLKNLVSDQLSYGHSGGQVEGKQQFVNKIVSGKSDFVTIDLSNQTIAISDNTAVVRHNFDSVTNDSGKPGEVHLLILEVWQKQKQHWQLLARQAVHKPEKP